MPQRPNPTSSTSPHLHRLLRNNPQAHSGSAAPLVPVSRTASDHSSVSSTQDRIRELANIRQLPPGTLIFSCGEPSDHVPSLNQPSSRDPSQGNSPLTRNLYHGRRS